MWIIPKNLPIYRYAQDTKALGVDSEEFSQMSENSLMWRSKPSLSQTWLRRWKRVSYIQRLSTQTLKPSHTKSFVEKWTSSLRDSHVNPSHRLVAELPQTILDTFTPTSQRESRSADQLMLFSKMSRGLSVAKQPMGSRYSSMSSEIWKKEITEHRGEYSLRLKLELHTNGRESLSWPTPAAHEARLGYQRRHAGAKGTQKSLTTVVIEDGLLGQDKSNTNGKSQESPSVLNPNWVEQMMGLPVGWTQLPTEWTD